MQDQTSLVAGALTIIVPLPPRETHPNNSTGRGNWRAKYRASQDQRSQARVSALAAMNEDGAPWKPAWQKAKVQLVYHRPGARAQKSDQDNLIAWAKATVDGLADAGVFANDRGVTWLPPVELLGAAAGDERKLVIHVTCLD